jgi:hypothetical protein
MLSTNGIGTKLTRCSPPASGLFGYCGSYGFLGPVSKAFLGAVAMLLASGGGAGDPAMAGRRGRGNEFDAGATLGLSPELAQPA